MGGERGGGGGGGGGRRVVRGEALVDHGTLVAY